EFAVVQVEIETPQLNELGELPEDYAGYCQLFAQDDGVFPLTQVACDDGDEHVRIQIQHPTRPPSKKSLHELESSPSSPRSTSRSLQLESESPGRWAARVS